MRAIIAAGRGGGQGRVRRHGPFVGDHGAPDGADRRPEPAGGPRAEELRASGYAVASQWFLGVPHGADER